uniref:sensor histidine kinase n=1 Tax=Agathobacter sp. TaxID=2021311 RepID=UPI004055DAE0
MKHKVSLSIKLVIAMLLLVTGTICLCLLLNSTFLEKYYTRHKQYELIESFETLDKAGKDKILEKDEFDITFEKLCSNANLDIIVIDAYYRLIRTSSHDVEILSMQLQEMLRGGFDTTVEILESTEQYVLQKQTDKRLMSDNLVLWGRLESGSYVYIRTALESIRESAMITKQFFVMVGIFGIVVSSIVIFILANSISKPIQELTYISKRMSNMDFEVKYLPKKEDTLEIDELGTHMNELSDTLEKTISELKVANNELKQDIAKKEKLDEMRKEFLSNVSHELKTPLALISGYAEGLKENISKDPEDREYYCDVIIDETDKMTRMVKKLLTLNQLEFGNDTVEMVRFNITEMIANIVQATQILTEGDITFVFQETEPVFVWADEFKTEEVLTNYISNAIHHVQGEKRICIYYQKGNSVVRICVSNTGKQIPEDELDKIWMKFYKVDKARTREYGGSGIGLSIVKAIMDSMHRKCGVRNLENGVEFWLELESGCFTEKSVL